MQGPISFSPRACRQSRLRGTQQTLYGLNDHLFPLQVDGFDYVLDSWYQYLAALALYYVDVVTGCGHDIGDSPHVSAIGGQYPEPDELKWLVFILRQGTYLGTGDGEVVSSQLLSILDVIDSGEFD